MTKLKHSRLEAQIAVWLKWLRLA